MKDSQSDKEEEERNIPVSYGDKEEEKTFRLTKSHENRK